MNALRVALPCIHTYALSHLI